MNTDHVVVTPSPNKQRRHSVNIPHNIRDHNINRNPYLDQIKVVAQAQAHTRLLDQVNVKNRRAIDVRHHTVLPIDQAIYKPILAIIKDTILVQILDYNLLLHQENTSRVLIIDNGRMVMQGHLSSSIHPPL